jgi:hypothetical protein
MAMALMHPLFLILAALGIPVAAIGIALMRWSALTDWTLNLMGQRYPRKTVGIYMVLFGVVWLLANVVAAFR